MITQILHFIFSPLSSCNSSREQPLFKQRKHLTLRTRIKRLARKSICFSKSVKIHDLVIGLFINRYEFQLYIRKVEVAPTSSFKMNWDLKQQFQETTNLIQVPNLQLPQSLPMVNIPVQISPISVPTQTLVTMKISKIQILKTDRKLILFPVNWLKVRSSQLMAKKSGLSVQLPQIQLISPSPVTQ